MLNGTLLSVVVPISKSIQVQKQQNRTSKTPRVNGALNADFNRRRRADGQRDGDDRGAADPTARQTRPGPNIIKLFTPVIYEFS